MTRTFEETPLHGQFARRPKRKMLWWILSGLVLLVLCGVVSFRICRWAVVPRDIPVLGLCRGIQILNVAHGGTVRNSRDEPSRRDTPGVSLDSLTAHSVMIVEPSNLSRIVGAGARQVNSVHFQASFEGV